MSRPERQPNREAAPPNYGRAYDDLRSMLEKNLQKARAAGLPFDAESVMPRATFDILNDDTNLSDAGWNLLREEYYERDPSHDTAPQTETPATQAQEAPAAPEPKKEPLRTDAKANAAPDTNRESKENAPKPHEYVVQKTRDGFRIMKRGSEKNVNKTFATNVGLSEAIIAHLERDPAFGVEVASEANRLRKEWRYRRELVVDLPVLEKVEWGTPAEVDAQFEEFLKDPSALAVVARYKDRNRRKTKTIPANEVFPGAAFSDVIGKIPKRSPEDPAAQPEWDKWGNTTFRDGVVDHIVGETLAQRYADTYGEPTPTQEREQNFEQPVIPAQAGIQESAPTADITPESHRLTAFAGPSGPQEDIGDLASRWVKENPNDTDTTRAKTLPKKGTGTKVDKSTAPAPAPAPTPKKKAPKGTLEIVEFHDDNEPMEVRDEEVIEVKETAKEAEIAAARAAITATLDKLSRAIPELGEQLAAPGMSERMTDWYAELFTGMHIAPQERAAFGLVYDKQTRKVVVKMKTFRNAVQAFKNLHEKKGA